MHNTRIRSACLEQGRLPDLLELQCELTDQFLTCAASQGITPVLSNCYQTPRLGFDLPIGSKTRSFLKALTAMGWHICPVDTESDLTKSALDTRPVNKPDRLLLYLPILIGGRMIHGASSGIRVAIVDKEHPSAEMAFPDSRFGSLPVNEILDGKTITVRARELDAVKDVKTLDRVDIVYTWVDDSDPVWMNKRNAYSPDNPSSDAADKARFESNDELLFSLRSLFRYFIGIGRVFLVTDGQTPAFLSEFEGRITIVDHSEIMGNDVARPTFNSHVIESCLHKIEGLGPKYLYLNDDFLFAKPACPIDFFDTEGRSKVFFSQRSFIPKGEITEKTLAVNAAAINLRNLMRERYNRKIRKKFQHTPVAIHRDVMFEIESIFADEFAILRQNRFRSRTDLSPSSSLYLHYALMKKRAIPSKIQYRYYSTAKKTLFLKLIKLSYESDYKRPKVHCINATGNSRMNWWNARCMATQMAALYPPTQSKKQANTKRDRLIFESAQLALSLRTALRRALKRVKKRKSRSAQKS